MYMVQCTFFENQCVSIVTLALGDYGNGILKASYLGPYCLDPCSLLVHVTNLI